MRPHHDATRRPRGTLLAAGVATLLALTLSGWGGSPTRADDPDPAEDPTLYLVTLAGPGTTGHRGPATAAVVRERMLAEQDALLTAVAADEPVYRWTTALNGFAVELDREQATRLAGDRRVSLVEENQVRPVASTAPSGTVPGATRGPVASVRGARGAGVVIGFVDTGVDPTSRAFSRVAALGPASARFRGRCAAAPHDPAWDPSSACTPKLVGARHFVAGFDPDRLRSTAALSPRDTHGHGTEVASVAAGTAGVRASTGRNRIGTFSGVAPRARIAAYKACWTAPDPADDGCATADLVAAVDRATADRVDVLNLSVGGPSATIDTVERALLGATEAGIVVTAAAGNKGTDAYAAHPAPWVVTVGAAVARERRGAVVARNGPELTGAMAATGKVGPARLVVAADVPAAGATRADAAVCAPGSLDARKVAGAIVLCRRGDVGRVEKSATVDLADGVGVVLANQGPGSTDADLHAVPTVHVSAGDGRTLHRWAVRQDRPRVRLESRGWSRERMRVAKFSSGGDPTSSVLKPDLVAPGTSVLAATRDGWDVVSGTSVATARVSGIAATLLGRRGTTPAQVRSALLTTTAPVKGPSGVRAGTGQARLRPVPDLAYLVAPRDYRAWLHGRKADLDLPHALLSNGRLEVRRTLTNTGDRTKWITVDLQGFDGPVRVSPSAALVRPGRSHTFTISVPDGPRSTDRGTVVWRSEDGDRVRLAVVVTR